LGLSLLLTLLRLLDLLGLLRLLLRLLSLLLRLLRLLGLLRLGVLAGSVLCGLHLLRRNVVWVRNARLLRKLLQFFRGGFPSILAPRPVLETRHGVLGRLCLLLRRRLLGRVGHISLKTFWA